MQLCFLLSRKSLRFRCAKVFFGGVGALPGHNPSLFPDLPFLGVLIFLGSFLSQRDSVLFRVFSTVFFSVFSTFFFAWGSEEIESPWWNCCALLWFSFT